MVTASENGTIFVTLINAKARVFPKDEKTSGLHGSIPRRELMGAVLGVELLQQVQEAFPDLPKRIFCWTDSRTVLR